MMRSSEEPWMQNCPPSEDGGVPFHETLTDVGTLRWRLLYAGNVAILLRNLLGLRDDVAWRSARGTTLLLPRTPPIAAWALPNLHHPVVEHRAAID